MASYSKQYDIEKQFKKKLSEAGISEYDVGYSLDSEISKLIDDDDEIISALRLEGKWSYERRIWIFTNTRLIIAKRSEIEAHMFYSDIKSVDYSDKMLSGNSGILTVEVAGFKRLVFKNLDKSQGRRLATVLKRIVAENASAPSSSEMIILLEKLASLKKQGLITDEEFQREKSKLMRRGIKISDD